MRDRRETNARPAIDSVPHLATVSPIKPGEHAKPTPPAAVPPADQVKPAGGTLRSRPRVLTSVVLAALVAGVVGWYAIHAHEETTDNAQVTTDVIAVPARTTGVVVEIAFKDNEEVKKGAILARIDSATQRARLAQAEAEVRSARYAADAAEAETSVVEATARGQESLAAAALEGSKTGLVSADNDVTYSSALVKSALTELSTAKAALERSEKLFETNAEPKQRLEAAQSAFEVAEANLTAAKAREAATTSAKVIARTRIVEADARLRQAGTVEAQIARARAQRELAQARLQAAQAARDLAELDLSYTTIVAPRSGIVSNRTANVGQMIQSGQPIVNIVSSEDVWVVANFKETQVGRMRPGQKAKVSIDTYGGLTLPGEVTSLSGGTGAIFSLLPPENATGNFTKIVQRIPVRIRLTEIPPEKPLRAGMSIVATVDVSGAR